MLSGARSFISFEFLINPSNYNSYFWMISDQASFPSTKHALTYRIFLYRCRIFASKTQFDVVSRSIILWRVLWHWSYDIAGLWKVVDHLVHKLLPCFSKIILFLFGFGKSISISFCFKYINFYVVFFLLRNLTFPLGVKLQLCQKKIQNLILGFGEDAYLLLLC